MKRNDTAVVGEQEPLAEAARELVGIVAALEGEGLTRLAGEAARVAGLVARARAGVSK